MSGSQRADYYSQQLRQAKSIADRTFGTVDPVTGRAKPQYKRPKTVAEAQKIIRDSHNATVRLVNEGIPTTPKARPQGTSQTRTEQTTQQPAQQPTAQTTPDKPLAIAEGPSKVLERLRGNVAYRSSLIDRIGKSEVKVEVLDKNIDSYTDVKQVRQYKKIL